jgi:hypothetical protein
LEGSNNKHGEEDYHENMNNERQKKNKSDFSYHENKLTFKELKMQNEIREVCYRFLQLLESISKELFHDCMQHTSLISHLISNTSSNHDIHDMSKYHDLDLSVSVYKGGDRGSGLEGTEGRGYEVRGEMGSEVFTAQSDLLCIMLKTEQIRNKYEMNKNSSSFYTPSSSSVFSFADTVLSKDPQAPVKIMSAISYQFAQIFSVLSDENKVFIFTFYSLLRCLVILLLFFI